MSDAYDFAQMDKWAQSRIDDIFSNPAKHKFEPYSRQDLRDTPNTRWRGRKGARLVRLANGARACVHCHTAKHGHAKETERL